MAIKRDNFFAEIVIIVAIIGSITINFINNKKALNWEFRGPVEKIVYNEKHTPTITLNHREYNLYYTNWNRDDSIYVGDTIIKKKGSLLIKLIRKVQKRHK